MEDAQPTPIDQLIGKVEIDPNADCFTNALYASIKIIESDSSETPRIYEMDTPEGPHAYLLLRGQAFNKGVTWSNNHYPDYSAVQITENGKDVTEKVLGQVLDPEQDTNNYHRHLLNKFGDEGLGLARMLFNRVVSDRETTQSKT